MKPADTAADRSNSADPEARSPRHDKRQTAAC